MFSRSNKLNFVNDIYGKQVAIIQKAITNNIIGSIEMGRTVQGNSVWSRKKKRSFDLAVKWQRSEMRDLHYIIS